MNDEMQHTWDPLKEAINFQTFSVQQKYLLNEITRYRNRPYLLKLFLSFCILLAIISCIVVFVTRVVQLIIGVAPLAMYYSYVLKRQEKFILYLICEKNKWAYNPEKDFNRAEGLISFMPNIFNQGRDQNVDEQIW